MLCMLYRCFAVVWILICSNISMLSSGIPSRNKIMSNYWNLRLTYYCHVFSTVRSFALQVSNQRTYIPWFHYCIILYWMSKLESVVIESADALLQGKIFHINYISYVNEFSKHMLSHLWAIKLYDVSNETIKTAQQKQKMIRIFVRGSRGCAVQQLRILSETTNDVWVSVLFLCNLQTKFYCERKQIWCYVWCRGLNANFIDVLENNKQIHLVETFVANYSRLWLFIGLKFIFRLNPILNIDRMKNNCFFKISFSAN